VLAHRHVIKDEEYDGENKWIERKKMIIIINGTTRKEGDDKER